VERVGRPSGYIRTMLRGGIVSRSLNVVAVASKGSSVSLESEGAIARCSKYSNACGAEALLECENLLHLAGMICTKSIDLVTYY
jgi:hypothetical protein